MLSSDGWVNFTRDLMSNRGCIWDPIENISSLIILTSAFNKQYVHIILPVACAKLPA
jgi:hypothetical protein